VRIHHGRSRFSREWQPSERAPLCDYADHAGALLAAARAADAVEQALTDPLTAVGNRALLLDRLEHELGRADRARRLGDGVEPSLIPTGSSPR
jgi:GGDEF domain-containing protein